MAAGSTSPLTTLQWGRDQLIAELLLYSGLRISDVALQWGRDQLIAELLASYVSSTPINELQWGRDQLIAELHSAHLSDPGCQGFNGAAIN